MTTDPYEEHIDIVERTLRAAYRVAQNKHQSAHDRITYFLTQAEYERGIARAHRDDLDRLASAILEAGGKLPEDEADGKETAQLQA